MLPNDNDRPSLALYLLGAPRLEQSSRPIPLERRKALALLAYLAVTGEPQPRDTLAALFWPEANASEARAALRRTLSVVNTALGGVGLEAHRESIGMQPDALWVDVLEARRYLAAAAAHHGPGEQPCADCLGLFSAAAELYRGDFMAGFSLRDSPDFDEWQFQEAEALRRELAEALEALTNGYAADGDYRAALEPARRWVALDPLHEPAQRALMKLYAYAGQPAAAQRVYQECCRLLEAELDTAPEPETQRLNEAIRAGQILAPRAAGTQVRARPVLDELSRQSSALAARQTQLPAQTTPLLGRVEELAQLAERLADPACRLVTLVGPGGSGKTRLALQAAANHGARTGQPIVYVPLATTPSPAILVAAVAEAIGVVFYDEVDTTAQLLDALRDRDQLVLLDNFEHLLPGAGLLSDILAQAPRIKVMVTSRERLHLHGEWVLELTGLPYPANAAVPNTDFYEAVQLFAQSARQARADFVLDDATRPAVVDICRLVEGLPLGLELAAAWVRLLSAQEIASEITRNLDFLATNRRDVPARQRSLRAAFEHSWQLLDERERQVMRRLAVFRRTFVRSAAEQVAGANLEVLAALADKSLLRTLPPRGGHAQYELHELMRQFAADKLAAVPAEAARAQQLHASYYTGLLAGTPDEKCPLAAINAYFDEIAAEIEDVRTAWQWAVTHGQLDALERAEAGLFKFYKRQAWFQEGKEMLGLAAQRVAELAPDAPAAERARYLRLQAVLTGEQGVFCTYLGLHHKAQRLYQLSLELLREHGEAGDLAFMVSRAGLLSREMGRDAEARWLLEESVALARQIGDLPRLIKALHLLGYVLGEVEDFPAAVACQEEAVSLARQAGLESELAGALNSYGFVRYMMGDFAEALALLEQSLALRERLGGLHELAVVLDNLGYVKSALRRAAEAQADFLAALRLAHGARAVTMVNDIIVGLAGLLPLPDEGSRAVELLAYVRHSPLSWRESRLRAERWLAERASILPAEVVAAAEARGQAAIYEEVVADLLGASPDGRAPAMAETW